MNRRLFRGFALLSGAEAISKILTFAAFAYAARVFGPSSYGQIEWAGAVLMCAGLIVDQGLSIYGAREIAGDAARTARLINDVVLARLGLAFISSLAVAAIAVFGVTDGPVSQLLLVYAISLMISPFLLSWVFQGHDRMDLVALVLVVRQAVFALAVFALVRSARDVLYIGLAEIAAVTAAASFGLVAYRWFLGGTITFKLLFPTKVLREGTPIGISQILWVVRMYGATLIVGLIASPEETGYFAGAMRIMIAMHAFVWLYYFNLLPSLARAWKEGPLVLRKSTARSMKLVLPVSTLIGVVWIASSGNAMSIAYGPSFVGGASVLQTLAIVWVFAAVSGIFRFGLIVSERQNNEMVSAAIGAVFSLVTVVLGYRVTGIAGAAAGLAIAEGSVLISSWLLFRRNLKQSDLKDDGIAEEATALTKTAI